MSVTRRQIFEHLTLARTRELLAILDINGLSGLNKADLIDKLSRKSSLKPATVLEQLKRDELKALCEAQGLDSSGREKQLLIDRLLGKEQEQTKKVAAKPTTNKQKRTMSTQPQHESAQFVQAFRNIDDVIGKETGRTTAMTQKIGAGLLSCADKIWETADTLRGAGIKASEWPSYMMPFFALMMLESRLRRFRQARMEEYGNETNSEFDIQEPSHLEWLEYSAKAANKGFHPDLLLHGKGLKETLRGAERQLPESPPEPPQPIRSRHQAPAGPRLCTRPAQVP